METGLTGKAVLVTGASGGIGRAVVEVFADEGARVALLGFEHAADMREWAAAQPWAERSLCVEADVRDPDAVAGAFADVVAKWGRLDVCVANAGKWPRADEPLHEMSPERARETIAVNLLGSMWTARAYLSVLAHAGPRDNGQGASLIFIGSTAGRFGERDHCDYAAAKAGLVGLALSLKNEIVRLDPYGRVNVIEPGWTVTHMARPTLDEPGVIERVARTMALRQLARAKDIARTALWLASPTMSRHVTGQVITVAGGMEGRTLWESGEIDEDEVRRRLRPDAEG